MPLGDRLTMLPQYLRGLCWKKVFTTIDQLKNSYLIVEKQ